MKNPYKMRVSDVVLIVIMLILSLSLYFIYYEYGKNNEGKQVIVTLNGKEYGRYSINENKSFEVKSSGFNKIEIKDGRVYVVDADCPDKYCINHDGISKKGESIVCLPHKLVVEVSDDEIDSESNNIDVVVQ